MIGHLFSNLASLSVIICIQIDAFAHQFITFCLQNLAYHVISTSLRCFDWTYISFY